MQVLRGSARPQDQALRTEHGLEVTRLMQLATVGSHS